MLRMIKRNVWFGRGMLTVNQPALAFSDQLSEITAVRKGFSPVSLRGIEGSKNIVYTDWRWFRGQRPQWKSWYSEKSPVCLDEAYVERAFIKKNKELIDFKFDKGRLGQNWGDFFWGKCLADECQIFKRKVGLLSPNSVSYRIYWGERWGSNPRQPESQSGTLPTELRSP